MTERAQLLRDIEAFCELHGIGHTHFGTLARNDRALVWRLRQGRDILTGTAEQIRTFMRDYRPPGRGAKSNPKKRAYQPAA